MNSTLRIAVALAVMPAAARDVAAQWNVERYGAERNQMYATFGLDPAVVASFGYGRVVPMLGRNWQFGVEGGLAAPDYDRRDFRARVQIRTTVLQWRSLRLVGSMAFISRGTQNSIYRAFSFGSDFTGTLGVYRRSWFLAGEFGFDKAEVTHITHSEWYRRHYYPEAKDGWYLNTAGTFHIGATGGVALGRLELGLRAGWLQTENFNDLTPPMYAGLGLGVRF
jgi:hypothetical protein